MLVDTTKILNSVKLSKSRQGLTNCMKSLAEIEAKIIAQKLFVVNENPLLVIEKCDGFYLLYYFLEKDNVDVVPPENMETVLQAYSPLYADITVKGDFQFKGSMFEKLGMQLYHIFIRKSVVNKGSKVRTLMDTEFAVSSDMEEIYNMLKEQFDLMCDHIPTKDELVEMIHKKQILKIAIKNQIAGVLLFEDFGKRAYARALCVAPDYQNSFVGYALLADYFSRHLEETRLFYLWVDEANMQVKKLHDRFGYQFDGLKNYIFRRG